MEELECFANRGSADAELARELDLAQPRPRRERAPDDFFTELVRDERAARRRLERSALKRGRYGRVVSHPTLWIVSTSARLVPAKFRTNRRVRS